MDGMVDSPPYLRLAHHASGTPAAPPKLLFLHLSLPIQFHPRFRCTPGATPLPQSPPELPEGAGLEPLYKFEHLCCSAGVRHPKGEGKGEKGAKGGPATPTPRDQPRAENEKDATAEKGETHRGFLFKARKTPFAPPRRCPPSPAWRRTWSPTSATIPNTTTRCGSSRVRSPPASGWGG
ncbi:ryanodine receptor 1-like [Pluvialis apricaria]